MLLLLLLLLLFLSSRVLCFWYVVWPSKMSKWSWTWKYLSFRTDVGIRFCKVSLPSFRSFQRHTVHTTKSDSGNRFRRQPLPWPAWLDVGIKSKSKFTKSSPISGQSRFYIKRAVVTIAHKSTNIWATFVGKLVANNFKNRPIWSHWSWHSMLHMYHYGLW